jgi:diadenosine tetraphosphate (Ap4A) HIT family hydrolase
MDCIFCKIVRGEIPSHKVYEDKDFLAILDISPNTRGVTLVLTKKHYPSYAFDMPDDVYKNLLLVTKKVAKTIDKALGVKRTAMVMEGMEIDHAHIKLYPIHGLKESFEEIWAPKKIFFEKYEGYVTTQLGPRADDKELEQLAKKIRESF